MAGGQRTERGRRKRNRKVIKHTRLWLDRGRSYTTLAVSAVCMEYFGTEYFVAYAVFRSHGGVLIR